MTHCGKASEAVTDCSQDSDLFLSDSYDWDVNFEPDIIDFGVAREMYKAFIVSDKTVFYACRKSLTECLVEDLTRISAMREEEGKIVATPEAIRRAVYRLTGSDGIFYPGINHIEYGIENFMFNGQLLSNLTTFLLGDIFITNIEVENNFDPLCSNYLLYDNNLVTIDMSGATLGFFPCRNFTGLKYLRNFICKKCFTTGWHPDLFRDIQIEQIDLSGTKGLSERIQESRGGGIMSTVPSLVTLDMSSLGISHFSDVEFFSKNQNLTFINLQNNRLISWNVSVAHNEQLKILYLQNNSINTIEEKFRDQLSSLYRQNNLKVYLAGNQVACLSNNCDPYITWLVYSGVVADAHLITCRSSSDYISLKHMCNKTQQTHTEDSKLADSEIAIIVVGVSLTLALIALFSIIFNNRYAIKYCLMPHRPKKDPGTRKQKTIVYCSHSATMTEAIAGKACSNTKISLSAL